MTLCILALYKWTDGGTFPKDEYTGRLLNRRKGCWIIINDLIQQKYKKEVTISPKVRDARKTYVNLSTLELDKRQI